MKTTALRIERWLSDIETRIVPPSRKRLQVIVYEAGEDKERALAKLAAYNPAHAGRTVEDISWSDDLAAAKVKALAEHIAAHPEDAGLTVADIDWIVREIVLQPQELIEDGYTAKDAAEDTDKDAKDAAEDTDKDAAVSETPNVLSTPDATASSKPWRPVHQRPARDMRRPTWKKWER
jgi:hypothetical protein